MTGTLLASAELPEGSVRLLTVGSGPDRQDLVLIRHEGAPLAYVNACPHMGIQLDWVADRVLSPDRRWLRCTGHGALFRIADGLCVRGPCAGDRLRRVAVAERDGAIRLGEAA